MPKLRDSLPAALLLAVLAPPAWAVPTTLDQQVRAEAADDAELEAALKSLRDMMYPAGERVENWDVGGADLEAELRALGPDKYYVLETDASAGTMVGILTARPIADFVPAAWRVVQTYGSADSVLENPSIAFGHLTPRLVLAGRTDARRMRDVHCSDGIDHAILYEIPGAPESPEDKDMAEFVLGVMAATKGFRLCTRYDGDREKGYSVRNFLPDGRLVLNPDRSTPAVQATIVPAAPVDSLIKPAPPPPATPRP